MSPTGHHVSVRTCVLPTKIGRDWMRVRGSKGFKRRRHADIVLLQDVEGLGVEGEVVQVKRGRARNIMVPTGQAAFATPLNRNLYAKHPDEIETENLVVGDVQLVALLNKWVKRIAAQEVMLYVPTSETVELDVFDVTDNINTHLSTNILPFAVTKVQRVTQAEGESEVFTRSSFKETVSDVSKLQLSEPIEDRSVVGHGDYIVTLDLTLGQDLDPETENYPQPAVVRFTVTGDRDRAKIKSEESARKERPVNPRKMMYRAKKGIEGATWDGYSTM